MTDAQKRLNEIEEQEKALADEKAKLLAESKVADLDLVKKLCKQHGFTATQLRSSLKTKSKKKSEDAIENAPTAKKPAAKKSVKAK